MNLELSNIWGIIPASLEKIKGTDKSTFQALLKQNTPPLDGTYKAEIRNNVAIIPVFGMIVPRDYWYYRTSLEVLAHDITTAVNNPAVKAIILNMDSPGGLITGCVEMTALIRQAKAKKPVIAFAQGACASACYWIASACTEIVVSPTSEAGSLGVVWDTWDSSERDKKDGYENIQIVSDVSPDKRPDIKTPEGRAKIQAIVNSVAEAMVADIASNRGVTIEVVKTTYGKGGLFVGQQIVDQKMAESVNTLEGLIDKYKSYSSLTSKGAVMNITQQASGEQGSTLTAESIQKDYPGIYQGIFNAGKTEGIRVECERIKKIEAAVVPGYESIVAQMKFDSTKTDSDVCVAIVQAQKEKIETIKTGKTQASEELNKKLQGIGTTLQPEGQDTAAADRETVKKAAEKRNKRGR